MAAFRSGTSLLMLGLIIGSLAVAHGRELLDGKNKGDHKNNEDHKGKENYKKRGEVEKQYPRNPNKCYPNKQQKECPYNNSYAKNCFAVYQEKNYVKVVKKPCFANNSKVVVAYTSKEGYPKGSNGGEFFAKCGSEVKMYILDSNKYYNKYGKKNVPDACKKYAGKYNPCNVCEYKFKVECKQYKKPQYPEKYEDNKNKYEDKEYVKEEPKKEDKYQQNNEQKKKEEEYKQKQYEQNKKEEEYKQKQYEQNKEYENEKNKNEYEDKNEYENKNEFENKYENKYEDHEQEYEHEHKN